MPGGRGLWGFRAATAGVRPACPNTPPYADGLPGSGRHPSARRRRAARVRPRHGVHGTNSTADGHGCRRRQTRSSPIGRAVS